MKKRIRPRKQQQPVPTEAEVFPPTEEKSSFFQPVRVASSPSSGTTFLSCVVHGDQEVDNRKRMVLRLTETATVRGKEVPAGTLIYGMTSLAQNRIQVVISRIGTQVVNYRVYDHTYHEGITLDERDEVVQEAAKETAWRQGRQRTREIPQEIASDLARGLLQRTRQRDALNSCARRLSTLHRCTVTSQPQALCIMKHPLVFLFVFCLNISTIYAQGIPVMDVAHIAMTVANGVILDDQLDKIEDQLDVSRQN